MTAKINTAKRARLTGYARDVLPERAKAGMDAEPVPVATASGKQEGVPSPAERAYKPNTYEMLTADEAQARMIQRMRGELPPIKGGLDDFSTSPDETDSQFLSKVAGEMDGFSPTPPATAGAAEPSPAAESRMPVRSVAAPASSSQTDAYLRKRKRVLFELKDGTVSLSAVDVIAAKHSITVLLPVSGDSQVFIPKVDSDLTVTYDKDVSVACYCPGATFEIPELGLMGLCLIKNPTPA